MGLRVEGKFDLSKLKHRVDEIAPEALAKGMEHIRGIAVERTPVETGHLAGSAEVQVDGKTASLKYPGPYARYQHEELQLRHETGQSKYLETSIVDGAKEALRIVAAEIKEAL